MKFPEYLASVAGQSKKRKLSELNCESLSSFEGISLQFNKLSGNDGEEATPVPMPNTEVKLFSADGSWGFPPVRVGRCQVVLNYKVCVYTTFIRRISSAGRASALQAEGRRFEPVILHHN